MRCPDCKQRVPLVELGEHALTCSGAELHPFDVVGKREERRGSGHKKARRGGDHASEGR